MTGYGVETTGVGGMKGEGVRVWNWWLWACPAATDDDVWILVMGHRQVERKAEWNGTMMLNGRWCCVRVVVVGRKMFAGLGLMV